MYFYQQVESHFDRIERGMGEKKNAYTICIENAEG